jgi:hypothetical protein
MIRFAIAALALLALSACHTTELGRQVGWPAPQRISE